MDPERINGDCTEDDIIEAMQSIGYVPRPSRYISSAIQFINGEGVTVTFTRRPGGRCISPWWECHEHAWSGRESLRKLIHTLRTKEPPVPARTPAEIREQLGLPDLPIPTAETGWEAPYGRRVFVHWRPVGRSGQWVWLVLNPAWNGKVPLPSAKRRNPHLQYAMFSRTTPESATGYPDRLLSYLRGDKQEAIIASIPGVGWVAGSGRCLVVEVCDVDTLMGWRVSGESSEAKAEFLSGKMSEMEWSCRCEIPNVELLVGTAYVRTDGTQWTAVGHPDKGGAVSIPCALHLGVQMDTKDMLALCRMTKATHVAVSMWGPVECLVIEGPTLWAILAGVVDCTRVQKDVA